MAKKKYSSPDFYERKLERVMDRLGIDYKDAKNKDRDYNYSFDRRACWVEFKYRGDLYRFDHSVEKARSRGIELSKGSDAFAQVVLALEDLVRMVEMGIYELQTWVSGMKYLPPPIEVPSFFRFLGFTEIPSSQTEVQERYRTLAKQMHPDAGGSREDFEALHRAAEQAM